MSASVFQPTDDTIKSRKYPLLVTHFKKFLSFLCQKKEKVSSRLIKFSTPHRHIHVFIRHTRRHILQNPRIYFCIRFHRRLLDQLRVTLKLCDPQRLFLRWVAARRSSRHPVLTKTVYAIVPVNLLLFLPVLQTEVFQLIVFVS